MLSDRKTIGKSEVYYHALYHHVAHWGAYVAMMGLLVTIGILVCLTPVIGGDTGMRKVGLIVGIIASAAGAVYFIRGMDTYGGIVNTEYLPQDYLNKVQSMPHKMMILVGHAATFAIAGWDIWLVASM